MRWVRSSSASDVLSLESGATPLQVQFDVGRDVLEDLLDVRNDVLYSSVQLHVTKNGTAEFVNQSADQLS